MDPSNVDAVTPAPFAIPSTSAASTTAASAPLTSSQPNHSTQSGGGNLKSWALAGNIDSSPRHKTFMNMKAFLLKKMRPWAEFFGKDLFKTPSKTELSERVERNLRHFICNYVILVSVLLVGAIIMRPSCLIAITCACGLLYFTTLHGDTIHLGGAVIPTRQARYGIGALAGVALLCLAGMLIMVLLAISLSGTLVHASMHVGKVYDDLDDDDDDEESSLA